MSLDLLNGLDFQKLEVLWLTDNDQRVNALVAKYFNTQFSLEGARLV